MGLGDNAYAPVPTDQYGYQEVGGDGSYNPNIAADGTDLTNAPISPDASRCCVNRYCQPVQVGGIKARAGSWTIVGEFHNNWNDLAWLAYAKHASSNIGVEIGIDGKDFDFAGYDRFATGSGLSQAEGNDFQYNSHQVDVYMEYFETKWDMEPVNNRGVPTGSVCYWYDQWDEHGITKSPGNHYIIEGTKIWDAQNKAKTRWRTDGCVAFANAEFDIPGSWWYSQPWPYDVELTHSAGITYGFGAGVNGIAFQTETDHSTSTEQGLAYNSGNGMPRANRGDPLTGLQTTNHYFWGSSGPINPNGGPQPRTFFNC